MSNNSSLYRALALCIDDIADAYDEKEPVSHRFSMKYKLRKRTAIKAYRKSAEQPQEFDRSYRKISLSRKVVIAVLAVMLAAMLTGAGFVVTHYIGGLRAEQQSTHTDAFAMDWESAPKTLEKTYRISYDLDDYNKEVLNDSFMSYWENYTKDSYYINFLYFTKKSYQNARLNTEGTNIEERVVNGLEALYFMSDDGGHCLIWDNGEYIFEMIFNVDYDFAVKVAESIKEL